MADYVVKFTGQDNLSGTINNIKQELKSTGQAATGLDSIKDKFKQINNSSAPLKSQLRQLKGLLAQMNEEGTNTSGVFGQVAVRAGEVKNAINHAGMATKAFASDTMALDSMSSAMSGLAGTASLVTGAMATFGTENENVEKAIMQAQGALSMLNGVQAIATTLNQNSALMLGIKKIQILASAAATTTETAATEGATIAQRAFNLVAKSNPYVLLATAIIAVGTAILAFTKLTNDSTEAEKAHQKQLEEEAETYNSNYANALSGTMTSYQKLREEYKQLKTAHEKTEWIANNQSEFNKLGISVDDVTDAESVFVNNSSAIIKALDLRAQAAANAAQAQKVYQDALNNRVKAGDKLGDGYTEQQRSELLRNGDITRDRGEDRFHITGKGEKDINNYNYKKAQKESLRYTRTNVSLTNQANNMIGSVNTRREPKTSNPTSSNTSSGKGTGGKGNNDKPDTAPKFAKDSLDDYNNQIDAIKNKLSSGLFNKGETEDSLKETLANLQTQADKKQIELGFKEEPKTEEPPILSLDDQKRNTYSDSENKAQQINYDFNIGLIGMDEAQDQLKDLNEQLKKLKLNPIKLEFKDDATQKLEKIKAEIEDFKQSLSGNVGSIVDDWIKLGTVLGSDSSTTDKAAAGLVVLGQSLEQIGGDGAIAKAGAVMAAIGQIILGFAQASAEAISLGPWGWLAFVGAGLAAVATTISTIQGFADGGIVQGASYSGDKLMARVNSGEMILNGTQQKNLFDILNGGSLNGGNTIVGGTVKIKGSDLYLALKNYNSKMDRIR